MTKPNFKGIVLMVFTLTFAIVLTSFERDAAIVKLPKPIKKQYSFVPNGIVSIGEENVVTEAFYMSKYEVSNHDYNEFLDSLKSQGKTAEYQIAKIDTNNWVSEFDQAFMNPYAEYYHRHPAYNEYPVVNISEEGAKLYCEWLTEKLNTANQDLDYTVEVKLPSRAQWLQGCDGGHEYTVYSWGSPYLTDEKGQYKCNFSAIGAESISFDNETNSLKIVDGAYAGNQSRADITAPIFSYLPNDFDLYNMNGNVAEMVAGGEACGGSWNSTGYDVRNQSVISSEKTSTKIGFRPIFTIVRK